MNRLMGKPTICIGENKDADQLRISFAVTAKLISAFVFATRIVQPLFYLNPKFQAPSSFLCLYRSVCVGPVRKPHCWFSHETAPILSSVDDVTLDSRKPSFAYNIHTKTVQISVRSLISHSIHCQDSAFSLRYTIRVFLIYKCAATQEVRSSAFSTRCNANRPVEL